MNIEKMVIDEERFNYKCFDELKRLLATDEEFKSLVITGYEEGKVYGFPDILWEKIKTQNIRMIDSFESVFRDGANIGCCTVAAKQLSYSLNDCFIAGGVLPALKGTRNCEDGSHTWIVCNGYVIDTSLMLIIEEAYSKKFGYQEENRYNPNYDPIYQAAKTFTLDPSLRPRK